MSAREPQRLATWILTRCTSEYRRESLLGDLMEQYQQRGPWWYWWQALGALRAHTLRLILATTENEVRVVDFVGDLVLWLALGMCALIELPIYADLIISWTPLVRSERSITAASVTMGALVVVAAITAHRLRTRTHLSRAHGQRPVPGADLQFRLQPLRQDHDITRLEDL